MSITFADKMRREIILLDGAFGTYAASIGLDEAMFGGRTGCMDYLSISSPGLVSRIHNDYFASGADAVETNTFGANYLKLADYGLEKEVYDINRSATLLARKAADEHSSPSHGRFVVGSIGPTGKLPSSSDPTIGNISYARLAEVFAEQARGIIDGGADAVLIETSQDLLEMKAAYAGIRTALSDRRKDLPILAQCTLSNNGRMLLGTEVSAVMAVMSALGAASVGINCSTGPVEMESHIKFLSDNCPVSISCIPNAGLPVERDGCTVYPLGPDEMAAILAGFLEKYRIDLIGGCCGTTPLHIKAIRKELKRRKPKDTRTRVFCAGSYRGYDVDMMDRPIKVGERINTQGSKAAKRMFIEKDMDGLVELGKSQERSGADILDVCAVLTERDTEKEDASRIVKRLAESVDTPLMIDSTDEDVLKGALESYPGTAFINSVNLEDGGGRADRVFSLAQKHGAFVVNLSIDKDGMAKTVEKKVSVASRLYDMAVNGHGIHPRRLLYDLLTFTLGTGEKEYASSAMDTIEAIRVFKKKCPGAATILGVSNISFGLPKEARKKLNMVFLHHAVQAGLDYAIVNPMEYVKYEDIDKDDAAICEDLIFMKKEDALQRLLERYQDRKGSERSVSSSDLACRVSVEKCVFDRDKVNIIPALEEALKEKSAEEILNGTLMEAMRKVGEALDRGDTVLPFVLQSAEVMRKAIEHLKVYMPKGTSGEKGKILLATVFGDVHDIGKNLVKMILENNGFTVIDLGKQVPVDVIIREAVKNKVDAVGLSALLVSTARYMRTCVQAMHDAGLHYPVMIGGAPTNEKFAREIEVLSDGTRYPGGVFYSRDAFTGLRIVRALMDGGMELSADVKGRTSPGRSTTVPSTGVPRAEVEGKKAPEVLTGNDIPEPPFYGTRVLANIPLDEVFTYLDEKMVFNAAWGSYLADKGRRNELLDKEYRSMLKELKEESVRKGWLDMKAVYGYFECVVNGTVMDVMDGLGRPAEKIDFSVAGGRSIAGYFHPRDIVAFQAVTLGSKISEAIKAMQDSGDGTRSFLLHGMSVHLAEALAEYVHSRIRKELGLSEDQGRRYSPGYALWPELEDQKKIFKLLEIERNLDIHLTEACLMVPEQSTTAIIVHNPKAEY
ncbi:MAG: homocysteine S-methyltransferase family protein [Candidatus Omnitrophica bacterium]|nr:homocysteine S-methyltransferase family protein [Candidatus Omnitrophota bacterium]